MLHQHVSFNFGSFSNNFSLPLNHHQHLLSRAQVNVLQPPKRFRDVALLLLHTKPAHHHQLSYFLFRSVHSTARVPFAHVARSLISIIITENSIYFNGCVSGGVCCVDWPPLLGYCEKEKNPGVELLSPPPPPQWIAFEDFVAVFCTYLFCVATTSEIRGCEGFFLAEWCLKR